MMQVFYLRNLASTSVVALLFSAMSLGAIAEQESVPMDMESKATLAPSEAPEALPPMPEDMKPSTDAEMGDKVYQEMVESGMQGIETPNAPEESRALDRLKELNDKDALTADVPGSEMPDYPMQEGPTTAVPQEEGVPENSAPQASLATATPIASPMEFGSAKPKGNVASIAWDDEESREPQPEEDPNDPTSEGQGPHGGHKMGKLRQTGPFIPIIRMGENTEENRGFTIIKPWNS